ncbi:MAG: hypothetical protein ACR2QH_00325 [Geminicoccaceae bacterium]
MMKPTVLLILLLTSCAHQATDVMKTDMPVAEPKPGIRDQIVPGTTYGNVALQAKTIEALNEARAVNVGHGHCSPAQTKVFDTWAPNEPEPSEFNGAFLRWKELWTLDACSKSIDFEVVYMLHITGHINVSVSRLQDGEILALN